MIHASVLPHEDIWRRFGSTLVMTLISLVTLLQVSQESQTYRSGRAALLLRLLREVSIKTSREIFVLNVSQPCRFGDEEITESL